MPRALFVSRNLIGDASNISPALRVWADAHRDWTVDLLTLNDHAACLYPRMGVPNLRVVYEPEPPYDFEFNFDCGESFAVGEQCKLHQAEAYARMLGVVPKTLLPTYEPLEEPEWVATQPENVILISPFSRSCASREGKPPNKMLPWWKWSHIIRHLRSYGLPLRVLGAPDDRADELRFSEEEYLCGESLNRVALLMRDRAALLVTLDNGMGHLGASQLVPTFLFYPLCLGLHWIVPANPHLVLAHIDPATAGPAAILHGFRQHVGSLLAVRTSIADGL